MKKSLRSRSRLVRPLALVVLSSLGLPGCLGALTGLGVGMPEELRKNGVSAPARIEEIWDTGWTINDDPVIGMKVEVQPADRPPFEATIKKTAISRIAIPRFQPGNVIPVRFDPNDPTSIAVDRGDGARADRRAPSSGNRYRDRFVSASPLGAVFLPPPAAPEIYLGTADSAADAQALYDDGYAPLGGARVSDAPDPRQALEQGKEIGAALVVVYGHFAPAPGVALDVLPARRRPADPGRAAQRPGDARAMTLVSGLGPNDQFAAYWGKTRPGILGIVSRPLGVEEQARFGRKDGIVVESVAPGSPAAAAHIVPGDVLVAIDGKPFADPRGVPALITSLAGQRVRLDLIRDGGPVSVTAQLNPASP